MCILKRLRFVQMTQINSLWPSDAIMWQGSRSTLFQVMACCLTAPSHYLNQCWLIITKVQWCSSGAISLEISQPSDTKINLKIIFLIFYWNLPGANELKGHVGCVIDVQVAPSHHLPLNTWRNNNVVITSKRHHFYVITSKWRCFDVITTSLLRNVCWATTFKIQTDRVNPRWYAGDHYSHEII